MRRLLVLAVLVVTACSGGPAKKEPATPARSKPKMPAVAKVRTLRILPVRLERRADLEERVAEEVEKALRKIAGESGVFRLVEEGGEVVLEPVIVRYRVREIGAGPGFSMRDLGLDPGADYLVADVRIAGLVREGETSWTVEASVPGRGGDATPGVARRDADGDGRPEVIIVPAGHVEMMRPSLEALIAKAASPPPAQE